MSVKRWDLGSAGIDDESTIGTESVVGVFILLMELDWVSDWMIVSKSLSCSICFVC